MRFEDNFWGEKNKGFDELILNFKKSFASIEEFHKFLIESENVESSYARLLLRLCNHLSKLNSSFCFHPIAQALKQFVEEIAAAHQNVINFCQELISDVVLYQSQQKDKQKEVKHLETRTAELISSLSATYGNVLKAKEQYHSICTELSHLKADSTSNMKVVDRTERKMKAAAEYYRLLVDKYRTIRDEFEEKFAVSCNNFQEIEETHLLKMKNFCITYADMFLICSENLRETRRKFLVKSEELSVESLIAAFINARKTGTERPPKLEFEEPDLSNCRMNNKNTFNHEDDSVSNNSEEITNHANSVYMNRRPDSRGIWKSKDKEFKSKRKLRKSKKQLSETVGSEGHPFKTDMVLRSKSVLPLLMMKDKWQRRASDVSANPCVFRNKDSKTDDIKTSSKTELQEVVHNRSCASTPPLESSSESDSDDEIQKLKFDIKPPVDNAETSQQTDKIKEILSNIKPLNETGMKSRQKSRNYAMTWNIPRCHSVIPFSSNRMNEASPNLSLQPESPNPFVFYGHESNFETSGNTTTFKQSTQERNYFRKNTFQKPAYSRYRSEDECSSKQGNLNPYGPNSIPLAVGFVDMMNSVSLKNESRNQLLVRGILIISFPAHALKLFSRCEIPLGFRIRNFNLVNNVHMNESLISLTSSNATLCTYTFSVASLRNTLSMLFQKSPLAPFYNVEVLKYEKTVDDSLPFDMCHEVHKTESDRVVVTVFIRPRVFFSTLYNASIKVYLLNQCILCDSKPLAAYNPKTRILSWHSANLILNNKQKITFFAELSTTNNTRNSSIVKNTEIEFTVNEFSYSGLIFELTSPNYRISLLKNKLLSDVTVVTSKNENGDSKV